MTEEKSVKKEAIKLKKLTEMDTIWHPESTLVFKSSKEKKVIGRWVDKQFIELDDEALDLTEKWGFKYDKELYNEIYSDEVVEGERESSVEQKDDEEENLPHPKELSPSPQLKKSIQPQITEQSPRSVEQPQPQPQPQPQLSPRSKELPKSEEVVEKSQSQYEYHTENTSKYNMCDTSSLVKLCTSSCSGIIEFVKDIIIANENLVNIIEKQKKELKELSVEHEELLAKHNIVSEKLERLRGIMSI